MGLDKSDGERIGTIDIFICLFLKLGPIITSMVLVIVGRNKFKHTVGGYENMVQNW